MNCSPETTASHIHRGQAGDGAQRGPLPAEANKRPCHHGNLRAALLEKSTMLLEQEGNVGSLPNAVLESVCAKWHPDTS
ncbi:MAG: hypothetical protein WAS21_10050 [Geminicoccaceae bacterium]